MVTQRTPILIISNGTPKAALVSSINKKRANEIFVGPNSYLKEA